LANRTVVLADDGAATGSTIIAAAIWIRATKNPSCIIVAIPVIPKETLNLIKKEYINHIEAIITPPMLRFKSVEQYYHRFEQLTDKQVIEIIDRRMRY
jgi:predicted phosphoribosyltransferase